MDSCTESTHPLCHESSQKEEGKREVALKRMCPRKCGRRCTRGAQYPAVSRFRVVGVDEDRRRGKIVSIVSRGLSTEETGTGVEWVP